MKANRWESFLTSWKFFSLLVVLQFILMPVATKGFKFEAAGDIVLRCSMPLLWICIHTAFIFR
jgi:hypothetical protein